MHIYAFRPSQSIVIHSQLKHQFPNHVYDDHYDVNAIYDVTQLVLPWKAGHTHHTCAAFFSTIYFANLSTSQTTFTTTAINLCIGASSTVLLSALLHSATTTHVPISQSLTPPHITHIPVM